jgi:hypothetical protein
MRGLLNDVVVFPNLHLRCLTTSLVDHSLLFFVVLVFGLVMRVDQPQDFLVLQLVQPQLLFLLF